MEKRTLAAFDMDGTLTTRDTMIEFLQYTHGRGRFAVNFFILLPVLVLYKMGFIKNDRAKSIVLSRFYKGKTQRWFREQCGKFADRIDTMINRDTFTILQNYLSDGSNVAIVSASIADWIEPWAQRHGITTVIGTRLEADADGKITGKLATPNCYGQEKVNMLLEKFPLRDTYTLYAYGDSRGDRELLAFADKGQLVQKK